MPRCRPEGDMAVFSGHFLNPAVRPSKARGWDVSLLGCKNFVGVWELIKWLGVCGDWVALDLGKLCHQFLLSHHNLVKLIVVPACKPCHVLDWGGAGCGQEEVCIPSFINLLLVSSGSQVAPFSFVARTCVSPPALWGLRIWLVMAKNWWLSLAVFRCQMSCWCCLFL